MGFKIESLLFLLLFSSNVSAQQLKIDVLLPSVVVRQDSAVMTLKMNVSAADMDSKHSISLTPIVKSGDNTEEFPAVILNGERAHRTYRRANAMKRRKNKNFTDSNIMQEVKFNGESQTIEYRASVPAKDWMSYGEIVLKREDKNADGRKVKTEMLAVPNQKVTSSLYQMPQTYTPEPVNQVASAMPITETKKAIAVNGKNYKGSFLPPESDATDERNKKELKFNLEEARVMVNLNPRILSLRELYTVAISYKDNKDMFYKIIDISVRSYPSDPIANLNAASAAIERANIQEAGRYLQMASRETLAYKNCRGVYELLCNNTYEGIRLLKSAKAEGSEEAAYNLKLFFESNK